MKSPTCSCPGTRRRADVHELDGKAEVVEVRGEVESDTDGVDVHSVKALAVRRERRRDLATRISVRPGEDRKYVRSLGDCEHRLVLAGTGDVEAGSDRAAGVVRFTRAGWSVS
jgi:hypothetical protein